MLLHGNAQSAISCAAELHWGLCHAPLAAELDRGHAEVRRERDEPAGGVAGWMSRSGGRSCWAKVDRTGARLGSSHSTSSAGHKARCSIWPTNSCQSGSLRSKASPGARSATCLLTRLPARSPARQRPRPATRVQTVRQWHQQATHKRELTRLPGDLELLGFGLLGLTLTASTLVAQTIDRSGESPRAASGSQPVP